MHCVLTRFSLPWLSKFEVAGWHESECVRVSFLLSKTDANRPFSVQTTIHLSTCTPFEMTHRSTPNTCLSTHTHGAHIQPHSLSQALLSSIGLVIQQNFVRHGTQGRTNESKKRCDLDMKPPIAIGKSLSGFFSSFSCCGGFLTHHRTKKNETK